MKRIAPVVLLAFSSLGFAAGDPAAFVPASAPRTSVLAGRHEAFRDYCTTGEGAAAFARIKEDFDRDFLTLPFPAEPVTYGDPSPSRRTSAMADLWRDQQDVCGLVSGVAEAATLLWRVTGDKRYLAKAKEFLLAASQWHFAPDWKSGAVVGATDILYNDEAHFRLWRKMPLVYDQLRGVLSPAEKKIVLDHFRERGTRSAAWIGRTGRITQLQRNSLAIAPSSHPVRFMAMTGLAGLALWDDLPEARAWWDFAYRFYRDQFPPWGGDDGGWAEGVAYWRGTQEHAFFQDALFAVGDPLAYATPFWKNSPYFAVYNVQPYLATSFGDLSNAGKFNLEPGTADYLHHLARLQGDGHLRAFAELVTDPRPSPAELGLAGLDRRYPTAAEFLVRNFGAADRPMPAAAPLARLPASRHFRDVGWVSMHRALGRPDDDIHLTFVSSPYGSFSHSHAHQNGFVLNAHGAGLAVNSGFREWHNSPHHEQWVRQTRSKNALLIDGLGQRSADRDADGAITRFESGARYTWTTGDATPAYATLQPAGRVQRVTRDLVFIDRRYVIVRDRVVLATPGRVSWLMHTERTLQWSAADHTAFTRNGPAALTAVLAGATTWEVEITDSFPVEVDPKYTTPGAINYVSTGEWNLRQNHFTATTATAESDHTIFAVLWPDRAVDAPAELRAVMDGSTLIVTRPDGRTDRVQVGDDSLTVD